MIAPPSADPFHPSKIILDKARLKRISKPKNRFFLAPISIFFLFFLFTIELNLKKKVVIKKFNKLLHKNLILFKLLYKNSN